jgi:hypothetical protein
MFKPFYIHRHSGSGFNNPHQRTRRGFTMYVSPNKDDHQLADVRVAWCSGADNFCRKTGRQQAEGASVISVNKRDLPRFVAQAATKIARCQRVPTFITDYYYLYRYML